MQIKVVHSGYKLGLLCKQTNFLSQNLGDMHGFVHLLPSNLDQSGLCRFSYVGDKIIPPIKLSQLDEVHITCISQKLKYRLLKTNSNSSIESCWIYINTNSCKFETIINKIHCIYLYHKWRSFGTALLAFMCPSAKHPDSRTKRSLSFRHLRRTLMVDLS